jgi:choline dehydrogenase-like flavoprotein
LESGGFELDAESQALCRATNVGLPYFPLDENRQRRFGGTTNLWAGWCRPLDEIDFEERSWVARSGWPIAREELLPYYARAQEVCQLGPFDYRVEHWEKQLGATQLAFAPHSLETKIYQLSPPTRFGEVYRDQLCRSASVRVVHHANVIEVQTTESANLVTRVRVACLGGPQFHVQARRFVLAAGAIENARLLLMSNRVQRQGLGNASDLVGRCFMEHLHFPSGVVFLPARTPAPAALYVRDGKPAVGRLFIPARLQEQLRLLNYNAMLEPVAYSYKQAIVRALTRTMHALRASGDRRYLQRDLRTLLHALGGIARMSSHGSHRSADSPRTFVLHHTLEQAPNPDSRMLLSDERDALGLPRVKMDWRLGELERYTFLAAQRHIARELERTGLGRLQIDPGDNDTAWPPDPLQGLRGHHMGTTRMSSDPRSGVVDGQCRVHGIDNLFVAGSSVFPTSGSGTPTYTIVALALRLADYLRARR